MPDLNTLLERADRAASQVPLPSDGLERLRVRRDRKHRNQRIAAGVTGIAVFVAAIVSVGVAARDGDQRPATTGTTLPSAVSDEPPLAGPDYERVLGTDRPDYVLDLETGAETPLPEAIIRSLGDWRPSWSGRYAASPDGSTLAYVAPGDDGRFQIFIANLDGSGIRQLTLDPLAAISPAWSPDATEIAYHGTSGGVQGVHGLFVVEVATGQATKVIDVLPSWDAVPTFTPDGSSLLYSEGGEVRIVPVAGGTSTVLFGHGRGGMGNAEGGSMSPDGSLVTMMGHEIRGPGAQRFVANADGTGLRSLQVPPGTGPWSIMASTPAGTWSPDGTRIVCQGFDHAGSGPLLVVEIVTGQATKVAEGRMAIWLGDHSLLVEP